MQITEEQRKKASENRKTGLAPVFELRKLTKRKLILENRAIAIRNEQKELQKQINKILSEMGAISNIDPPDPSLAPRANWHSRIYDALKDNPQGLRLTDISHKFGKPSSYFQNVLGQMAMKNMIKRDSRKVWTINN